MRKILFSLVFVSFLFLCCSSPVKAKPEAESVNDIENAASNNSKTKTLCTGFYFVVDSSNAFKYQLDRSTEFYYLDPNPILIKGNIISTEIYEADFEGTDDDYTGLEIVFDEFGTTKWADATKKATLKRIALVIDNKLIISSLVNGQITGGIAAINRTEYNLADIKNFKKQLD